MNDIMKVTYCEDFGVSALYSRFQVALFPVARLI